jgi:Reverse transcriptase (RNA-dependent DNA polymerase)/GAG-pre-integrase domain
LDLRTYLHKTDRYLNRTSFDTDAFPIGLDSCTAATLSGSRTDFIGALTPVKGVTLKGVGGTVPVVATGTIVWRFLDDHGHQRQLKIENAFYVPRLPLRLLSPQQWAAQGPTAHDGSTVRKLEVQGYKTILKFATGCKTVYHDQHTNLPLLYSKSGYKSFGAYLTSSSLPTTEAKMYPVQDDIVEEQIIDEIFKDSMATRNDPISLDFSLQREPTLQSDPLPATISDDLSNKDKSALLLRWHYRLGHLPFKTLLNLAKEGLIPKALATAEPPKCAGCLYGKQTRTPWRKKPSKKTRNTTKLRVAKAPGDIISVDQMVSSVPGLMNQLKGTPTVRRYHYATIFVDQFSGLDYVHLMESITAEETIEAKIAFERFAASHGVKIKHYHADNGRFAENAFRKAVASSGQSLTFCGVNAHHQNGMAEKRIRDLQDSARSQLLHAKHNWPDAITDNLWPFALSQASHIRRNAPRDGAKSPLEIFASVKIRPRIDDFHTFGCPAYCLGDQAAAGKAPKWSQRSRVGINLGVSSEHASTVALILNIDTGNTSPQFHVNYDDRFETVKENPVLSVKAKWPEITQILKAKEKLPKPGKRSHLFPPPTESPQKIAENLPKRRKLLGTAAPEATRLHEATSPPANPANTSSNLSTKHSPHGKLLSNPPPSTGAGIIPSIALPVRAELRPDGATQQRELSAGRTPHRVPAESLEQADKLVRTNLVMLSFRTQLARQMHMDSLTSPGYELHPLSFAASLADEDTMTLAEAMRQPDKQNFLDSMGTELNTHDGTNWLITKRSDLPKHHKTLRMVWSMKRKRRIATGEIYKWKARLCVDGSRQQKGINYWDTYSPVVSWESVRTLLTIALMRNWYTRQIDFVLAYPQADAECDIYLEIPKGCTLRHGNSSTHVLKLIKNLYGTKQAGLVWFRHLKAGLESRGWVQSQADECVFFKGSSIFLFYVDDGIFLGPNKREIDREIKSLQTSFNLTDEGTLDEFLGIKITKTPEGGMNLTQPTLIKRILKAVSKNPKNFPNRTEPTPATKVLQKDLGGPPPLRDFDYRSVIGMLNFLCRSTRPDIAFAVSQCARFMANPRRCHERAVVRICQYLNGTKDKGMIMQPEKKESLVVYADSDFVGTYHKGHSHDPDTAKSRSSYYIRFGGCLIYWSSKLQTEITLSTTEAEYVCLSQALRTIKVLMRLIEEIAKHVPGFKASVPVVRCKAFEDNAGALELANAPRMRPRTKHINIKYHHFRVDVAKKRIQIKKIDTKRQLADIGTKPLGRGLFEYLRLKLMGW